MLSFGLRDVSSSVPVLVKISPQRLTQDTFVIRIVKKTTELKMWLDRAMSCATCEKNTLSTRNTLWQLKLW